jgi:hypothetical protein
MTTVTAMPMADAEKARARTKNRVNCQKLWAKLRAIKELPDISAAPTITPLEPKRSIRWPLSGAMRAPATAPAEIAPVNADRLQPRSSVIGIIKTERRRFRVGASLKSTAKATITITQP